MWNQEGFWEVQELIISGRVLGGEAGCGLGSSAIGTGLRLHWEVEVKQTQAQNTCQLGAATAAPGHWNYRMGKVTTVFEGEVTTVFVYERG